MSSSESIEELARLLTDEKRLDDKRQETQTVLSTVKKKISESLVTPYIQRTESPMPIDESLMQQEQSFERLLQALRDMKQEIQTKIRPIEEEIVQVNIKNLDESLMQQEQSFERLLQALRDMKQEIQTKIRPIEEEIVQVNIKNLNERYDNQKTKLGEALNTIDQTILDCGELIETTKNIHMELSGLNEKFSRLGASPLSARNSPRNGDIVDFIRQRIEHLRLQGKL